MRVLQTPVRFHPETGGVESAVYELSTRLHDRGHAVRVLCADTGVGEQRETVDGVAVRRLWSPHSLANTNLTPSLPAAILSHARWADVIHTHLPTPWSADVSALAGALTRTPVVLTYHNDVVGEGLFEYVARLYNSTGQWLTLTLVDRVLVTRPGYSDESPHLQSVTDKIQTVYNGVDVDRFRPFEVSEDRARNLGYDPDRPTLFFLSVLDEFHEYKGLMDLLEAVAILANGGSDSPNLVVGGAGPRRPSYEQRATELGIEDDVTFVGYVPPADLPSAYNAADAFVLPSVSSTQEGFGLVVLEALACETPVVTTDVVGVADEIAAQNFGRVVAPNDPARLADGIATVLEGDPDTAAGRRRCVEQYSWTESVDRLLEIYDDVCGGSV